MTEQEIIDVVTHFKNGGKVEFKEHYETRDGKPCGMEVEE